MAIDLNGINPAYPVEGVPTTASVRANFAAIKGALEGMDEAKADATTTPVFEKLAVGPVPSFDHSPTYRRANFTPPGVGADLGFSEVAAWGAGAWGAFVVERVDGTLDAPEPVPAGMRVGAFIGRAYAYGGAINSVAITFLTREDYGVLGGGRGSEITFQTTPLGASQRADALKVRNDILEPGADNFQQIGSAARRTKEIFCASSVINTSDEREKTAIVKLTAQERKAGRALIKEIGTYQFLSSVEQKGAGARRHVGMTVQRAIEVMQGFGLEPRRYGFICYDQWAASTTTVEHKDGTTENIHTPAGDRWSFRESQLIMFMLAAAFSGNEEDTD